MKVRKELRGLEVDVMVLLKRILRKYECLLQLNVAQGRGQFYLYDVGDSFF